MSYYLRLKVRILMCANPSPKFNCMLTFFLSLFFLVIWAFLKPFWLFKGLVAKLVPGVCLPAGRPVGRPAGDFETKTSTAPKLGLGLGAELGNII